MRSVLAHLERILERLASPESLEAEEVGYLAQDWDAAMLQLEQFPEGDASEALPPSEKIYLRVRLQRIIDKLPEVQARLVAHKSSVAQQLFTENRRLRSLHTRYAASFGGTSRLHQTV